MPGCPSPERALPRCLPGHGLVVVQDLTVHGVPRCERYGVMPLARMVQQSQYHPSLPAEERGSLTVQPPDKGRNFPRTGRKQLQQQLRVKLGRRQAWRLKTAQQLQGPGTPASARNKADLTTRHPAVQWGLEPRPTTAVTVSGQDLVGAEQRAGISAHPWYGSIGPSPITAQCGATPVPAVKERRQQGELVLWAACAHLRRGGPRPQAGGVMCLGCPLPPHSPQAQAGGVGATSTWVSVSTRLHPTR